MMGTKERAFAPLLAVTLEDLVPADHFYRDCEVVVCCQVGSAPARRGRGRPRATRRPAGGRRAR